MPILYKNALKKQDPAVHALIEQEHTRQEEEINLIASENAVSEAVLAATACIMTNKYAEGYPGKRYYAGCAHVDSVEELALSMQMYNPTRAPRQTLPF